MNKTAPGLLLCRFGLGGVFLWFGIDKFISPEIWVNYIPAWFPVPFEEITFIYLLGIVESLLGLLVVVGRFTRVAALISAILLIPIMVSLGYNEIMIRDAGLFLLALGLAVGGPGSMSFDSRIEK